ncbi:MAG TPA: 3-deoxy-7-phosphoheptulonate synthase [Verrucomicrobia bacterium]|nr:MAG: 3-deoxy-7-phosphoheptulonate synthase [Lentisphaerae bacterium GWF2_57_35]HBA85795.1 3-deoxy-7-phosphoheptulonate synthase [Verrucomicrobiota bacterium]
MLIVMRQDATAEQVAHVMETVREHGFDPKPVPGAERTAVCVLGNRGPVEAALFESLAGVSECIRVSKPYKLVSRDTHPKNTVVEVHGVSFGDGRGLGMIAGPCAVESRDQIFRVGEALAQRGVRLFRAGAFKPRTSPYAFQGLGEEGLALLDEVRRQFGVGLVTEAIDHENFDKVEAVVDIVQIGARNMQNFSLLRRAGKSSKPILLKRGMSATIEELLMAAEYIVSGGNSQVILCERGVRTFADHTRNTLDLSSIPVVKQVSHLPIIADPSHAAGKWDFVIPLSMGAVGVGADGLIVEVHPEPEKALSDGAQSLTLKNFDELLRRLQG